MSYQGITAEFGVVKDILEVPGSALLGARLKAPLSKYFIFMQNI